MTRKQDVSINQVSPQKTEDRNQREILYTITAQNRNSYCLPATDQLINWCNECNSLF
uniref:Uncharacterized protein n=1 Tax=Arundo donax TaxID=35708 RepID=A0A0A9DKK9_ARUDO